MPPFLLFDLDNTLYPKSLGIFDQVVERIRNYMEDCLGFEKALAKELRQEYIRKYGSTLRGLMVHYNLDPEEYLEYVHDVGVEKKLSPNPALAELLGSIRGGRAIFTRLRLNSTARRNAATKGQSSSDTTASGSFRSCPRCASTSRARRSCSMREKPGISALRRM